MNFQAVKAIYFFEMARFFRTLLQSFVSPVISTSLYFVVFGTAIGSRIQEVEGISYGAFIVPGLIMLSVMTQATSNGSFGIYFPKFIGTIYELLSAPVSYFEILLGYVGAAATKALFIGLVILATAAVFVDLKIPENFATFIKKDLNVKAKFSGIKDKDFSGKVEGVASRVNAETRSILTRVKIDNPNYELIPGSLLEVTLSFNKRDSLSIPDTSIILEGNKSYVYKISEDNIAERLEIEIGSRNDGDVEVISGLNSGDVIVAEGLKKVRPNGKIKPIDK